LLMNVKPERLIWNPDTPGLDKLLYTSISCVGRLIYHAT
jgi:hypothetical protein